MFLFRCSKGEHGVWFLTQPWPDADLQLALLIPQDPWIHSFLRENPVVMCFLSEKGVWEKGNKSNYLAMAFIFYPQPADSLKFPSARQMILSET